MSFVICTLRRFFSSCLWVCCLVFALACPGVVSAQDHITQRAWYEDSSGQLSWAEVQSRSFQPYQGLLSKGFGASVIWLRLHIDPAAHETSTQDPQRLILRIRPVYLDDIQVYDPLVPHGLAGIIGDLHHPRLDEFHGLDFLLPITRGTQARDIWLRLSSNSTRQIDVQALNLSDLNHRTHLQSLLFATYVGLVLMLTIWGLAHWFLGHERLIGVFGLSQLMALGFALGALGHLRVLWPASWPAWVLDQTNSAFAMLAVSTAIAFHSLLIREFGPPRWWRYVHTGVLVFLPVKLLMLAGGWGRIALNLNMLEVLMAPPVFLVTVLLCTGWQAPAGQRPVLSRPVVIVFYALLIVMLAMASLPGLGLIKGSEVALYIVQVHGLAAALWILLMLQYRAHMRGLQQHDTAMALERSELQIQQEREVREAQAQLLAMLSHELKTPLAAMQMRLDNQAPGSEKIRQSIRDMNSVIDRCQQTTQLSDSRLEPQIHPGDLIKFLRDAIAACPQPERVQLQAPAVWPLHTDPQLLSTVLNNLLENACKYAAPDSPITLELQDASGHAQGACTLRVSNLPGQAGWPDSQQVFGKYYRSPHARRQAGTGLGLFLVHNLVQVLGGRIDYAPDEHGIHFVLHLPATPPQAQPSHTGIRQN